MQDFEDVIVEYLANIDQGVDIDPDVVIARHPQFERQLRDFFDSSDEIRRIVNQLADNPDADRRIGDGGGLGEYTDLREIGRGGMGTVYEAIQSSMGRHVALKVIDVRVTDDPLQVERFQNEVRAVAKLNHEHIVPVYAVGRQGKKHFYAMQLIDGVTLKERIEQGRDWRQTGSTPFVPKQTTGRDDTSSRSFYSNATRYYRESAEFIGKVADAIHHAHSRGIIHRDVKPSNILIDREGKPWVTDFGLARLENEHTLTAAGDVVGTVQYMSPEQAVGSDDLDHRTDIYTLGVVLYLLLTGELPFRGSHHMVLRQVVNDEPEPLRSLDNGIPRDLETICLKCLRKDSRQRYSSAADLAADLRRFLDGQPIEARPIRRSEKFIKWCGRNRSLAAGVALAAVASIAIIGMSIRVSYLLGAYKSRTEVATNVAKESAHRLHQENYVEDMRLAYLAQENGAMGQVLQLLDSQVPIPGQKDLRGFGWYLLRNIAANQRSKALAIHDVPINNLAVFKDGRRLAYVGGDATINVWNLEAGQLEASLRDPRPTYTFYDKEHPDSIGTLAKAGFSRVPVSTTGNHLQTVAVSPNGKSLATGNVLLSIWDLESQTISRDLTLFPTVIRGVTFSPTGDTIAAHSANDSVIAISLLDDKLATLPTKYGCFRLNFSPDGTQLAAPYKDKSTSESGIRIWDTATWTQTAEWGRIRSGSVRGFTYSRQGRFVFATLYDSTIAVFDTESDALVERTRRMPSRPNDLALSPDNSVLAVAYEDGAVGYWMLGDDWQSRLGSVLQEPPTRIHLHDGIVNAIQFIDNQRLVTCGSDGCVRIWEVKDPWRTERFKEPGLQLRFLAIPNSNDVLSVTRNSLLRINPVSGERVFELPFHQFQFDPEATPTIAIAADGRTVAIGSETGLIAIADLANRKFVEWMMHSDEETHAINDLAFSSDGNWLASSSRDHTVRIRSTADWKEVKRIDTQGWGNRLGFSPSGDSLAYTETDGRVHLVRSPSWDPVEDTDPRIGERFLCFSPDGKLILTAHKDASIRVLDAMTLEQIGQLRGHASVVGAAGFHPSGRVVVSACAKDATLRLWHLPTFKEICTLGRFAAFNCAFTSDGSTLVASGMDSTECELNIWHSAPTKNE